MPQTDVVAGQQKYSTQLNLKTRVFRIFSSLLHHSKSFYTPKIKISRFNHTSQPQSGLETSVLQIDFEWCPLLFTANYFLMYSTMLFNIKLFITNKNVFGSFFKNDGISMFSAWHCHQKLQSHIFGSIGALCVFFPLNKLFSLFQLWQVQCQLWSSLLQCDLAGWNGHSQYV